MSTANDITRLVIGFLNARGHLAWRNSTMGTFDPKTKRYRTAHKSAIGSGDVVVCLKGGRYVEIEVKAGKDRLSQSQKDRQAKIIQAGGNYYVVCSAADFLELTKRNGWEQ